MYVCICNQVTESELNIIIKENPNSTIEDLQEMGVCDNCFKCYTTVQEFLENNK